MDISCYWFGSYVMRFVDNRKYRKTATLLAVACHQKFYKIQAKCKHLDENKLNKSQFNNNNNNNNN